MMRIPLLIIAAAVLAATPVSGQAPAPAPATPAAVAAPHVPALEPQGYDYKPSGRRDPFISLVRRSTEALGTSAASIRPTGLAGLSTDEVVMRGVMKGRNGYSALVRGADNRTYTGVKAGDELFDGTVKAVTADAIVILQNVSDPLSLAKKREVRKLLRPAQEAR
jgi:Tfp pilus assembly protein PilP